MIVIHSIILLLTFYLLAIICDRYFVEALDRISKRLKLSSEVTWATFMAIGSSAPELFTSIFAIFAIFGGWWWNESLWAGTIVGSAIFNILAIIWASIIAMKKVKKLAWQPIIRDLIFYSLAIVLLLITFWDGQITFVETWIFVVSYIVYIFIVKNWSKWLNYEIKDDPVKDVEEDVQKNPITRFTSKILDIIIPNVNISKNSFWRTFVVSIVLIAALSHFMVESAVHVAEILSIPKAIIWLTILAAGTSIPDLISSIIVAKRWKWDMAISNAVWSNIFDILFGLGFVYFVYMLVYGTSSTIIVDTHNLNSSIILLFATVITILSVLILRRWKTGKFIWYMLIVIYCVYLIFNILKACGVF